MMVRNDDWLREWIREELKEGVSPDLIKETLAEQGYDQSIVDEFLKRPAEVKPVAEIEPLSEVPHVEKPTKPQEYEPEKEDLRRKVKEQLEEGISPDVIKEALVDQGYDTSIIDEFLKPPTGLKLLVKIKSLKDKLIILLRRTRGEVRRPEKNHTV